MNALLLLLTISPVTSFAPDFIWGVASAALQIEGAWIEDGKAPSVWDNMAHLPGFIADGSTPEVGPDSYHLFAEDIKILKDHGIKHYRLSVSWPRIVPQGKKGKPINQKGIDYYRKVFQMLIANDIIPYVTLYHWDLPANLALKGYGIADKHFVEDFLYFADICFKEFGELIKNWFTFNEIWCMALLNDFKERDKGELPYKIAHNSLLAHAHTVNLYRKTYNQDKKGKIGIVLSSSMMFPKNIGRDNKAAERAMEFSLDWLANPVFKGDYPEIIKTRAGKRLPQFTEVEKKLLINSTDFFGINHYFSEECQDGSYTENNDYWSDRNVTTSYNRWWKLTDSGWPIVPMGLRRLLDYINGKWTKGTNIPIWVTENGIAVREPDVETAKNDKARIDYLKEYIEAMRHAIVEDKANVKAYFVWALLDNFEWWQGYSKRFGMVRVDYSVPPVRTVKNSLLWYSNFTKSMTESASN